MIVMIIFLLIIGSIILYQHFINQLQVKEEEKKITWGYDEEFNQTHKENNYGE